MATRLKKSMLVLGTTILMMQAIFMPVGMIYAEETMRMERKDNQHFIVDEDKFLNDQSNEIDGKLNTDYSGSMFNTGLIPFPIQASQTANSIESFPKLIRLNNQGEIQSGFEFLPQSNVWLANSGSTATFLNEVRVTAPPTVGSGIAFRTGDVIRFENVGIGANERPFHAVYEVLEQTNDLRVHSQGFSGTLGGQTQHRASTFIVHFEYADGSPVEGSVVLSLGGTLFPTLTTTAENMYAVAVQNSSSPLWGQVDPTVLSLRINVGIMNVFLPAEPHVQVWSGFAGSSVNLFDQHGPELDVSYDDLEMIGETEEEAFVSRYKVSQRIPSTGNPRDSLDIQVDNPDILKTADAQVLSIKDDTGADLSEVVEFTQVNEQFSFRINEGEMASLRGKTIDIELEYPIDKSKNPSDFLIDDYLEIDLEASNSRSTTVVKGTAKTWARPWGNPVPQEIDLGASTTDLDPAGFVDNIENMLDGDEPFVVGFSEERTFDRLGDTTIGVVIESAISAIQNTINVPITVVENKGRVFVHHVDKEGNTLVDSEELVGRIGDAYETHPKQIVNHDLLEVRGDPIGIFTEETIEVTYVYMVAPVGPVDPLEPEVDVSPENPPVLPEDQGLISIDFVSQFHFGEVPIQAGAATYDALPQSLLNEDGTVSEEERPNYVQVSDRRAENNGWELTAKLADDGFRSASGDQLKGARILLDNTEMVTTRANTAEEPLYRTRYILEPGNLRSLAIARNSEGSGTWIQRYGDQASAGASVTLDVPAGANPKAQLYEATIEWQLSFTPGNE